MISFSAKRYFMNSTWISVSVRSVFSSGINNASSSQSSHHVLLDKYKRFADGLINGDRASLAQAITLMESSNPDHRIQADLLQQYLFKGSSSKKRTTQYWKSNNFRIGIAGI